VSAPPPVWPAPGDWAWISRYAATCGLVRMRVVRVMATGGVEVEAGYRQNHYRREEFHETEAEAYRAAEKVVVREIAEHMREAERLQGLASNYARRAEETEGAGALTEEIPTCSTRP
jgi:hypothetical protein